jgi:3-oxoacyl-[acyl-carrier protein] reductase
MPMAHAYIALGSNLGDRAARLAAAIRRLRAEPALRLLAASRLYETAPVGGPPGQGDYLNAAVHVETSHSPERLLQLLLSIEASHGRIRTVKDSPRTLDLDLLLYDDLILNAPELEVPHPRMHERAFVLAPLAEIAAEVVHPVLKQTISALIAALGPITAKPIETSICYPQTLVGRRALVTGSTSGIGLAIAELFSAHGATVIRHGSALADLRDPHAVTRLANDVWGDGLDILVCNAGADTLTGAMAKASFEEKLDALLSIDLKATMQLGRDLGARMHARGQGSILTVGWDQAETGMDGDSGQLFAAVKGAILCFTRSLAKSLAPQVRVNALAPGWIRTAWGETASPYWQERVRQETPLGIWGLPEDVAEAALWLASPGARFITGQTVRINGGAV